ncbi:hypothetical protein ABEB36_005365 [Hypothenemus hampei]|uniref:C2H2-type domain-containing protein n=1 Tax=Hypothenemus hampei TaxID=57062 RepID=A0ABD1EXZ2_HYPHA
MSKQIIYSGDQAIIIKDEDLVWNENSHDQSSLQYFEANTTIINESTINESYASAVDSNETQYLSILDNTEVNEISLDELNNLTIENNDSLNLKQKADNVEELNNKNGEIVVFTMDGSNDLYGIQLSVDDEGRVQKYQFKFRTTDDGQLEPIPETVTLLPNDDIEPNQQLCPANEERSVDDKEQNFHFVPENSESELNVNEFITDPEELIDDVHEKEVAPEDSQSENFRKLLSEAHYLKEETILESQILNQTLKNDSICEEVLKLNQFNNDELPNDEPNEQIEPNHKDLVEQYLIQSNQIEVQFETEERAIVRQPSPDVILGGNNTNDFLRHVPVINEKAMQITKIIETESKAHEADVLHPKEDKYKRLSSPNVNCLVIYPEKENVNFCKERNVNLLQVPKFPKFHPKSILKTSFNKQDENCDLYRKRFARNKEAMRARHFHNVLNRTTIPHAPIRQQRQPRKQEIKPIVDRSSEEIIVQEVIVSSNGYIENPTENAKSDKVQVTAIVELSDSEDDSITIGNRRNRKASFNSESDQSVIEIPSDKEETNTVTGANGQLKRKRGRPPKLTTLEPISEEISSKEKVKSYQTRKIEFKCCFCPKTFPSQNSLNTHIIHHNLEKNLKNRTRMSTDKVPKINQLQFPKFEYNHKCESCLETFKNRILLEKHQCTKKQGQFNCSLCRKEFKTSDDLKIHKKTHMKSNLIKNTSILTVTPKRSTVRNGNVYKEKNEFKCAECPKICISQDQLNNHIKSHKKFTCNSCFLSFSSKILLDSHVRSNCVKKRPSTSTRASLALGKPVNTSFKRLSIGKMSLNKSLLGTQLECEKCSTKFATFRSLYMHKVQKHGMSTPDKNLVNKPKKGLRRSISAHGGIPANDRLRKAYDTIRQQIAESGYLHIEENT